MIEAIRPSIAMTVDDGTMVGEARRRANALADQLGFDETRRGKIALIGHGIGQQFAQARGPGPAHPSGHGPARRRMAGWMSWRWTRGQGWGTSADASLTVSRRRAAWEMGSGRSAAWPMIRHPLRPGVRYRPLGSLRDRATAARRRAHHGDRASSAWRWPGRARAATSGLCSIGTARSWSSWSTGWGTGRRRPRRRPRRSRSSGPSRPAIRARSWRPLMLPCEAPAGPPWPSPGWTR